MIPLDLVNFLRQKVQLEIKLLGLTDVWLVTESVANRISENRELDQAVSSPEKKKRLDTDGPQGDEESKWIHRDKLARIENEELQAAGIVLPKSRAHSRPRRDRSQEKTNGHSRSRKNSNLSVQTTESENPASAWDLRLPTEIAEDPEENQRQYWTSNGTSGKGSRIPVAKLSPAPIPPDFIERDTPISRKTSGNLLEDDLPASIPKPSRSRSSSFANTLDEASRYQPTKRSVSPTKKTTMNGTRKTPAKEKQPASNRSKTRSTSNTRSISATRPTTRSGEMSPLSSSSKAPEGDPPWMVSAYKPDPRLPPDQQLLPTVAKRLQQEKWEQEGKFGNIYDKEFRPLNDEGFAKPPPEVERPTDDEQHQDEWPLRADVKSPTSGRPGTSSYSTMPRIQDKSAKPPSITTSPRPQQQNQMPEIQAIRVPDAPDEPEEKAKGGCGCCIVM